MTSEELFEVVQPEQIIDGVRVESVTNLVTVATISGVQVKDTAGKHIEVKLRVPYTEEDLGALGDMCGEKTDIALQAVRFYEPSCAQEDQDDLPFEEDDDGRY